MPQLFDRTFMHMWYGKEVTADRPEKLKRIVIEHSKRYFFDRMGIFGYFYYLWLYFTCSYKEDMETMRYEVATFLEGMDGGLIGQFGPEDRVDMMIASVLIYDFHGSVMCGYMESGNYEGMFYPIRFRQDPSGQVVKKDITRCPFGNSNARCPGEAISMYFMIKMRALYTMVYPNYSIVTHRAPMPRPFVTNIFETKGKVSSKAIREILPRDGVKWDINRIFTMPDLLNPALNELEEHCCELEADVIITAASRGYLVAAPIATSMHVPLVLATKVTGEVPYGCKSVKYRCAPFNEEREIAVSEVDLTMMEGRRVVFIDDGCSTFGTREAIRGLGVKMVGDLYLFNHCKDGFTHSIWSLV